MKSNLNERQANIKVVNLAVEEILSKKLDSEHPDANDVKRLAKVYGRDFECVTDAAIDEAMNSIRELFRVIPPTSSI